MLSRFTFITSLVYSHDNHTDSLATLHAPRTEVHSVRTPYVSCASHPDRKIPWHHRFLMGCVHLLPILAITAQNHPRLLPHGTSSPPLLVQVNRGTVEMLGQIWAARARRLTWRTPALHACSMTPLSQPSAHFL